LLLIYLNFHPIINHPGLTNSGLALDLSIRSRILAKRFLDTATSAIWNTTYHEFLISLAPILISFSRRVRNDHVFTDWGNTIVAMLKHYHASLETIVVERKWFWDFEWPVTAIPLYRKHLIEGGLLQPNDAWFRAMWLYYCRNLHVWDSEETEWRGGCHRSMPEGLAKGLAAKWYPDIPEAAHWRRYGQWNFRDFWRTKDVPQNDTGYMMGPFVALMCNSDQYLGDDRFYTDPGMKRLWERLLVEITPDGAIDPYGPNGGYNSTADYRVFMLERLGAKTGNGRYRYGAHKLMNYLRYQSRTAGPDSYAAGQHVLALAWLFADDTIKPVTPASGSLWNTRVEAVRIPHRDKDLTERLLGDADPDPTKGILCCSWYMTDQVWPDKLVLRSGWNPGDLFALVELHPTSFPANPGGIMGMNRYGAPFTQIVTSKGSSQENRLLIEDLDGTAQRRYHPDRRRIDEDWRKGTMPDIRSEVTFFEDTPQATFARVRVENVDALPVVVEREFIFVKNRFSGFCLPQSYSPLFGFFRLAPRFVEFDQRCFALVESTISTRSVSYDQRARSKLSLARIQPEMKSSASGSISPFSTYSLDEKP
jgi:hypothetical protein